MNRSLDRWMGEEIEWGIPKKKEIGDSTYHVGEELLELLPFKVFRDEKKRGRNWLKNGGCAYRGGGGFETSTPECRNHYQLTKYAKAMDRYSEIACAKYEKFFQDEIGCWKANVDPDATTRGGHESYDVPETKFKGNKRKEISETLAPYLIPYFLTRQLFTGSGGYFGDEYVISPRSMVTKKEMNTSTRSNRGILCRLKSEDSGKGRTRYHHILSDGLRGDVPNLLKFGVTSYYLAAVEEDIANAYQIKDPAGTLHSLSKNTEGPWKIELKNRKEIDAVDYLNFEVMGAVEELFDRKKVQPHDTLTKDKFEKFIQRMEEGRHEGLRNEIEWIGKKYLIDNYLDRFTKEEDRKRAMELTYNLTDVSSGDKIWRYVKDGVEPDFSQKLGSYLPLVNGAKEIKPVELFSKEEVKEAVLNPPRDSRADVRVSLAEMGDRPGHDIERMNWSYVKIKKLGETKEAILDKLDWSEEKYEDLLERPQGESYRGLEEVSPGLAELFED